MIIGQLPEQNNRQILNQQEWAILEGLIRRKKHDWWKIFQVLCVLKKIPAKSPNYVCRGAKQ
jgi:hypothetical protein